MDKGGAQTLLDVGEVNQLYCGETSHMQGIIDYIELNRNYQQLLGQLTQLKA
ncbi:hypothetical protein [Schlesneria sp.]|uniref:hypothetical protein n=1 Tax=Schlesneria sp. TaxID=2762018 RepID=UPI002EFB2F21